MKHFWLLSGMIWLLSGCWTGREPRTDGTATDLPELKERGEITAVTLYSSISYFQYKMRPMGYEYEMIQNFAQSEGLKLQIKVAENPARLIEMLEAGEADIIAFPIKNDQALNERLIFCGQEEQDCQVLVQRANKGDTLLTDVTQLLGKEVYVKPNTKYAERLQNLNSELGGGIRIREITADTVNIEDLIEQVSTGTIPYTICDENIARLNKTYYWNLNISLKISFLQRSSWAVRKNSPLLAEAVDRWASDQKGVRTHQALLKRYFELSKRPETALIPEIGKGAISPYDDLFRKHARTIGWDWQLLAAIGYQESHFDPNAVSWAGAEGLMGIMPATARALGVTPHELKDPDAGIRTGVDCLRRFRQGFSKVTDPIEKIKFTLAAYNAGIGHVYDAQRLAEKYGKDPTLWDGNVAEYIRLKNEPEYYNDPVCKHGYLRGTETFNYVQEVMARYRRYLQKTAEE